MSDTKATTKFGRFFIAPEREVQGELCVAGEKSLLYVRDDDFFQPQSISNGWITGTLFDLTKVTLCQCVILEGTGSGMSDGERYYYAKLFPNYVLEGQCHIAPNDKVISQITIVFEDAAVLFHDYDAFGTVLDSAPYIQQIVEANKPDRPVPIGPEPKIAYFTGKLDIIDTDTVLGRVRVQHNPSWNLGGPRGVQINNSISTTLEPADPVTFNEAITRTFQLLRFLELVIGRPQNLQEMVVVVNGRERPEPLKVHWSHRPSRKNGSVGHTSSPHPADLLLEPIHRSQEFVSVLRAWMEKDKERRDARGMFHTYFAHQSTYSVDRLVGTANMFDILPESAAPTAVELSEDLQEAKRKCREIFKSLPESLERNGVLDALGRVGKASLKHKTKYRAQYLVDTIGERFPDINLVLNAAIDCRNFYVHGGEAKIDYNSNFDLVAFFTDTLEFVYGASEFVEAGWDIEAYVSQSTTMSHPFGAYRVNYQLNLQAFKVHTVKP